MINEIAIPMPENKQQAVEAKNSISQFSFVSFLSIFNSKSKNRGIKTAATTAFPCQILVRENTDCVYTFPAKNILIMATAKTKKP